MENVNTSATVQEIARRKSNHQQRVEQMMHRVCELTNLPAVPSKPTIPEGKIIVSRAKLILEEVLELFEACGISLEYTRWTTDGSNESILITSSTLRDRLHVADVCDVSACNLPEIAKELADVSVVTMGMFSTFGIADTNILEDVDINNLGKFGPGGKLNSDLKWTKPPNYPKPDINKLLVAQGWDGASNEEKNSSETVPLPR